MLIIIINKECTTSFLCFTDHISVFGVNLILPNLIHRLVEVNGYRLTIFYHTPNGFKSCLILEQRVETYKSSHIDILATIGLKSG